MSSTSLVNRLFNTTENLYFTGPNSDGQFEITSKTSKEWFDPLSLKECGVIQAPTGSFGTRKVSLWHKNDPSVLSSCSNLLHDLGATMKLHVKSNPSAMEHFAPPSFSKIWQRTIPSIKGTSFTSQGQPLYFDGRNSKNPTILDKTKPEFDDKLCEGYDLRFDSKGNKYFSNPQNCHLKYFMNDVYVSNFRTDLCHEMISFTNFVSSFKRDITKIENFPHINLNE